MGEKIEASTCNRVNPALRFSSPAGAQLSLQLFLHICSWSLSFLISRDKLDSC